MLDLSPYQFEIVAALLNWFEAEPFDSANRPHFLTMSYLLWDGTYYVLQP